MTQSLDSLEYPRLVYRADGTAERVESATAAKTALAAGLSLLPLAPNPHDGGTPNRASVATLPPAILRALEQAGVRLAASDPAPEAEPAPAKAKGK